MAYNLLNQSFGRLKVVGKAKKIDSYLRWRCLCDCGRITEVRSVHLIKGRIKSCGCGMKESVGRRFTKHGQSNSPTYYSWQSMITRCNRTTHWNYKYYGGRGIRVCDRWSSFENFLEDMGERPKGTTLDRIDVNGNYEPSNCRWADRLTQARNKRHVV